MKQTLKYSFGLSSVLLLLTACGSNVSPKGIAEATDAIKGAQNEFIAIDQELYEHEKILNDQFNELLNEDGEFTSIQDESAAVFKNISDREDKLAELTDQENIVREKAEYIGRYEGDDLPTDVIEQISNDFLDFADDMLTYQEQYSEEIESERNYFNNIAAEGADYEDFINGLHELNLNYTALNEANLALDEKFVEINNHFAQIDELTKEFVDDSTNEIVSDAEGDEQVLSVNTDDLLKVPNQFPQKFVYDSGVNIEYPEEGVKGIYTTAHSAGGDRMERLVELINTTDLNTMVIDIKDDYGNITLDLQSDNELVNEMTNEIIDAEELIKTLEENNIYPIARIVVFKDSLLAEAKPEWSFTDANGSVWANRRGESFVNPYLEEVWDYNIEVAIQAAKLGFKDIQYDYVRFPEGFENRADSLNYTHGHYANEDEDVISMEYRNRAVTEFVRKSKESLMPYGADLSVDIFGYAAVVRETPGIGQSFPGLAKEVDVISSMIYPSHWGPGNLDISKPDLEPYNVVNNYMKIEQEIFDELGEDAPITRPWIQDFTASYLGAGNYLRYGAPEVTAQVQALADNGVHEFLLWNAGNSYSEGATYNFQ